MSIVSWQDIQWLDRVYDQLKEYKTSFGDENVEEEELEYCIDWLYQFKETQPISILKRDLRNALGAQAEAQQETQEVKQRLLLAEDGVRSLKHLQQYEGHAKAASDKLGQEMIEKMLRQKIIELEAELNTLRSANG
jgi:hypothetical protein